MGFATYDALLAAIAAGRDQCLDFQKSMPSVVQGRAYSSWRRVGIPEAGTDPPALAARQVDASIPGGLRFANPTGGRELRLLRALAACGTSGIQASFVLVDRLLDYGAIDHTTNALQNLVNGAGLPRYADGKGVFAFLEVTTALGATAATCTLTYTNDAGEGGRTAGPATIQASAVVDGCGLQTNVQGLWFPLQAGDRGIRSVQGVQFSATNTAGASNLVLCKPRLVLPLSLQAVAVERDLVLQVTQMPRVEDGASHMFLLMTGASSTTPSILGQLAALED